MLSVLPVYICQLLCDSRALRNHGISPTNRTQLIQINTRYQGPLHHKLCSDHFLPFSPLRHWNQDLDQANQEILRTPHKILEQHWNWDNWSQSENEDASSLSEWRNDGVTNEKRSWFDQALTHCQGKQTVAPTRLWVLCLPSIYQSRTKGLPSPLRSKEAPLP